MLYDKIKNGTPLNDAQKKFACPDRSFAAGVFKIVKSKKNCIYSAEQIALMLGYGSEMTCKVRVAIDAFCELGLMVNSGGVLSVVENAPKVSLGSAGILKQLGYTE